jgi:hypothetical protein
MKFDANRLLTGVELWLLFLGAYLFGVVAGFLYCFVTQP